MDCIRKVGIYARVSTKDQTAENQLLDLRRYCDSHQWSVVAECVDSGISGAKFDRPELQRVLRMARQHQINTLLVWRFDRLARSLSHLVQTLEELKHLRVDFVSFSESVDTASPQGRMVFGVMASLAEFERELIRERIFSGLRRAKEKGVELGRPNLPKEKLEEVLSLRGKPQREIARLTGLGKGTVYRILATAPLAVPQNQGEYVASLFDEAAVA